MFIMLRFGDGGVNMYRPLRGRKKRRQMYRAALVLVLVACLAAGCLHLTDKALVPVAYALAEGQLSAKVNAVYQEALEETIAERRLVSSDFYHKTVDENGRIAGLSVNTLLVNSLCAALAAHISQELAAQGFLAVEVPLGAILGVDILANMGPRVRVNLLHAGGATVEYESAFEAAGINQINFRIWLRIASSLRTANPLRDGTLTMTRDVPLVNTVFAGEIPSVYLSPQ